jgi:phosphoribulokinase
MNYRIIEMDSGRKAFFVSLLLFSFISAGAELKPKERNILTNEAKTIDLAKVLITDKSWNNLPDYNNRTFWDGLPAGVY